MELVAGVLAGISLLALELTGLPAHAQVLRADELQGPGPLPSGVPSRVTEVARGEKSSLSSWQMRGGMPAHLHRKHEEVIIVQAGQADARIADETIRVGPGDVLVIRPGTVHGAQVVGEEVFRGVSVFSPGYDPADRVPMPDVEGKP